MIKAAVIGANGYTGYELLKLIYAHPSLTLSAAASRSAAGVKLYELFPSLKFAYGETVFCEPDPDAIAAKSDAVFTALPHAASAEFCGKLYDRGVKVIDLSADFRYSDIALYESTYNVVHPRPELNRLAVYGLCELNRKEIANAPVIGNPGCYTTCSILPLYPLVTDGVIDGNSVIIDAASGITGAGRKSDISYNYCETAESFKAYGVTTHRHTTEIEEKLSVKGKISVSFTPHLLPCKRGILATVYANLNRGATAADVEKAYGRYKGESFAVNLGEGVLPELKWVVGSNVCAFGYKIDSKNNRIIIVSAIDNLLKGASGQAIQNLNIAFGLPEREGLPLIGYGL